MVRRRNRTGWCVAVLSVVAVLPVVVAPASAQEAPATAMLVTYASDASLDRAVTDGGSLESTDANAAEIAGRVAAVQLTPAEMADVADDPGVVAVEPDATVYAADAPNDPCYTQTQPLACPPTLDAWHVDQVGLPTAWDFTHAGNVTVAVVDSGIRTPGLITDLNGKASEIDATYVPNAQGQPVSFGTPPCSSGPALNHGTAVSSMVGAATNNGFGIPGAGWDVRVLSVRAWAGPHCDGTSLGFIVRGIQLARQSGASVINLSVTAPFSSPSLEATINDAVNAGVVVVAAAGNNQSSSPFVGDGGFPAYQPNVIAVGSTSANDQRSTQFSNFDTPSHRWVDVFAPGDSVPSYTRNGNLTAVSGTSFSAPLVAGVVALMRAVSPAMSAAQISQVLTSTADMTTDGWPRLDAAEAVLEASCGFAASAGAGAAAFGSTLTVVTRGGDGRPCARDSGKPDTEWDPLDGRTADDPDLAALPGGAAAMVVRGGDGAGYLRGRDAEGNWYPWLSLGGRFSSSLTVVSWGPGRFDIFARGMDGALWHSHFNGSAFSGWSSLGGILTSEPDVASWAENRLDVFARGTDGGMWHRAWTGSSWGGWEALGGSFLSGPGAVSWGPDRIDVVARGLDSQLWIRSWTGTGYTGWTSRGGVVVSSPDLATRGLGKLTAVVRAVDRRLWQLEMTVPGSSTWSVLP